MEKSFTKKKVIKLLANVLRRTTRLDPAFMKLYIRMHLEIEFGRAGIPYKREKEYIVRYKDYILPHKFYADFVIFNKIILEIKGIAGIADEFIAQDKPHIIGSLVTQDTMAKGTYISATLTTIYSHLIFHHPKQSYLCWYVSNPLTRIWKS